jgi:hypothetical protein
MAEGGGREEEEDDGGGGSPGVAAVGLEGVRLGPKLHELHGGWAGNATPLSLLLLRLPLFSPWSGVEVDDSVSAASARRVPPLAYISRLLLPRALSLLWVCLGRVWFGFFFKV